MEYEQPDIAHTHRNSENESVSIMISGVDMSFFGIAKLAGKIVIAALPAIILLWIVLLVLGALAFEFFGYNALV